MYISGNHLAAFQKNAMDLKGGITPQPGSPDIVLTKVYLPSSSAAPPISPAYDGFWTDVSNAQRVLGSLQVKAGTALVDVSATASSVGSYLMRQFIIPLKGAAFVKKSPDGIILGVPSAINLWGYCRVQTNPPTPYPALDPAEYIPGHPELPYGLEYDPYNFTIIKICDAQGNVRFDDRRVAGVTIQSDSATIFGNFKSSDVGLAVYVEGVVNWCESIFEDPLPEAASWSAWGFANATGDDPVGPAYTQIIQSVVPGTSATVLFTYPKLSPCVGSSRTVRLANTATFFTNGTPAFYNENGSAGGLYAQADVTQMKSNYICVVGSVSADILDSDYLVIEHGIIHAMTRLRNTYEPHGVTGATGAVGAAGDAGANGINGNNGATGVNGADGVSGQTGIGDPSAPDGAPGTAGTNGAAGAAGAAGADGADGATPAADGDPGVAGGQGDIGNDGGVGGDGGAGGPSGGDGGVGGHGGAGGAGGHGGRGGAGARGTTGTTGAPGTNGGDGQPGGVGGTGGQGGKGGNGGHGANGGNGGDGGHGGHGGDGGSGVTAGGGAGAGGIGGGFGSGGSLGSGGAGGPGGFGGAGGPGGTGGHSYPPDCATQTYVFRYGDPSDTLLDAVDTDPSSGKSTGGVIAYHRAARIIY